MTSNLKVWDQVKTPNPKYTKKVTMRGGFTAVSPQYLLMRATEQFGMYGDGFGLSISDFDYSLLKEFRIVLHNAVFFYTIDGKRIEFGIKNTIEAVSKNGHIDTDFAKKVETNTISKALSKIGFAADVYMGMFDDEDYVKGAKFSQEMKESEEKEEKQREQHKEIGEWLAKEVESAKAISNIVGFEKAILRVKQKAVTRCQAGGFASKGFEVKLDQVIEDRKNEK